MTSRIGAWTGPLLAVFLGCNTGCGNDSSPTACNEAALDRCDYESPALAFTERDAQVNDNATGRVLPVRIRVPDGPGPFSVVVYSHGGGFNDNGHGLGAEWGKALASHGYVTVNVGHSVPTLEMAPTLCALGSVPDGECDSNLLGEESGMVALVKRRDVIAVLDALPAFAALAEDKGGPHVQTNTVAVIGWSAGSRATMAIRGTGFHPAPSAPVFSESDARVATIVAFSPTGPGFGGFFANVDGTSWDTLDGPTLMVTGENDVKDDNPDLTGAIRRAAYEDQPADGARRLLYSHLPVGMGGHGTYNLADQDSPDASLARLSRALRAVVRAHIDDTLEDNVKARAWLNTDDARILAGDADWVSK